MVVERYPCIFQLAVFIFVLGFADYRRVHLDAVIMDTIYIPENSAAVINLIIFVSNVVAKPEVSTFVHKKSFSYRYN